MINKFAHDIKIDEEGCLKLRKDLGQQGKWAKKSQMEFNFDMCEVIHFWKLYQGTTCTVNDRAPRTE